MKVVYICGPISADNQIEFLGNVRRGNHFALVAILQGFAPINPFSDYTYLLMHGGDKITKDMLQKVSLTQVEVCNELWALPGWKKSKGCTKEVDLAIEKGIPVVEVKLLEEPFEISGEYYNLTTNKCNNCESMSTCKSEKPNCEYVFETIPTNDSNIEYKHCDSLKRYVTEHECNDCQLVNQAEQHPCETKVF